MRTVQSTIEEAERAKKQYRFSLSNLGATTEEEKVAAMIAQTAFQKYQAGRYFDALEDYKRATNIAPRFSSIYRNWSVMESSEGHYIEADQLMSKAASLRPDDAQIWITWGNMKRKCDKIKDALEYYQRAYNLNPDDYVILNALGQAKCRLGDYEEADRLFRLAIQKEESLEKDMHFNSVRHGIINYTSIADNLSRWSEDLVKDRNYDTAEQKLKESLVYCDKVITLDENDNKSLELKQHVLINLGFLYKKYKKSPDDAINYFTKAITDKPKRYIETKNTVIASLQAAKIYYQTGNVDKAKEILSPKLYARSKDLLKENPRLMEEFKLFWSELYQEQASEKGKIIRTNGFKEFVIIELVNAPGSTYIGYNNDFMPKVELISDELIGKTVEFIPQEHHTKYGLKKIGKQIKVLNE